MWIRIISSFMIVTKVLQRAKWERQKGASIVPAIFLYF